MIDSDPVLKNADRYTTLPGPPPSLLVQICVQFWLLFGVEDHLVSSNSICWTITMAYNSILTKPVTMIENGQILMEFMKNGQISPKSATMIDYGQILTV